MLKILLIVFGVAVLLLALFGVIIFVAVKQSIIRPKNNTVDYDKLTEKYKRRYKIRLRNNQHLFDLNPEDLSIVDPMGNTLRAWFVPKPQSKIFVICIHGYKCNGPDECSHLLPFYNETLGANYLLPDHAAHGRSEGKYIGFGSYESDNLLLWVDYLIKRFGEDIEIVLHGISMGAVTAMLANQSNPPKQVKAIVEDCGFTSAFEIIDLVMSKKVGFPCPHITKCVFFVARHFFGYDMRRSDCIKRMPDSKNPILFIHGTDDRFVPFYMGERLYESCESVEKDKLFVKGAAHAFCYYDAKEEYDAKLTEFLGKHLSATIKK